MTGPVHVDPATANLVRALARKIEALEHGQLRHARASQAAYRSVESGGLPVYDETGQLRTIIGAQEDGTYTVLEFNGTPPPIPSPPVITQGIGAVTITWDGYDENDEIGWPADFARVEVHVSDVPGAIPTDDNQVTSFGSPVGGSTTVVLDPGQTIYVVFTAVNRSGAESPASVEVAATGGAVPTTAGPQVPAQVTGLTLSSSAYVEAGRTRAKVTAGWDPVTTDTSGTAYTPDHYQVQTKRAGFDWTTVAVTADGVTTTATMPGYTPGETVLGRVAAVNTDGTLGAWSDSATVVAGADTTPPPVPSQLTATSRLGIIEVTWDGTGTGGAAMPPDLMYVEVHASTTSTFTPTKGDPATLVEQLFAAGKALKDSTSAYGTTWYFRAIAVDTSGNASAASSVTTAVVKPLVDVTNFPDDAADTFYARTAHFIDITADNFLANKIQSDWCSAGLMTGIIVRGDKLETDQGATSGIKISNTGIRGYDGTRPRFFLDDLTGALTLYDASGNVTLSLNGANGSVRVTGEITSGSTVTGAYLYGSTFYTAAKGSESFGWSIASQLITGPSNSVIIYGDTGSGVFNGNLATNAKLTAGTGLTVSAGGIDNTGGVRTSGGVTISGGGITATGPIQLNDLAGTGGASYVTVGNGGVLSRGSVVSSSERLKHDVRPSGIDPAAVYAIEDVSWLWNNDPDGPRDHGVIAERLREAGLGQFTGDTVVDGELMPGVDYIKWAAVAHQAAIRDLHARVLELEAAR